VDACWHQKVGAELGSRFEYCSVDLSVGHDVWLDWVNKSITKEAFAIISKTDRRMHTSLTTC